jgi:predicted O-methyltransferase YrrM
MVIEITRTILRKMCYLYEAIMYPKFFKIKIEANGLMSPFVYKKMYELVYGLSDLDIIEVGGGAGAGSIAIASAMKDANKKSNLIVIEKCEGGSRAAFGDYQTNLNLINYNFKRFGVENIITLFPNTLSYGNRTEVICLIRTDNIAAMILDADGRIDRDFFLFWPFLNTGGIIIIDDYENCSKCLSISDNHLPTIKKKIMTYRLLNQIMKWGLFEMSSKVGKTVFGYKPENADFNKFDLRACEKIIEGVELEMVQ